MLGNPTNGDDVIIGTSLSETLDGLDGNDIISGKDGDDVVFGGEGSNSLYGDDGNDSLYSTGGAKDKLEGGTGDDYIEFSGATGQGRASGGNGDDIYDLLATDDSFEIHSYEAAGEDDFTLRFSVITGIASGHHIRMDATKNVLDTASYDETFADVLRFEDTRNVRGVVVGRLEDFDASRDTIYVDGVELNLEANGYGVPDTANFSVKIVEYDIQASIDPTASADTNTATQQWLLITTATGGHIFYTLEGARVDMEGIGGAVGNSGQDEAHFIPTDEVALIDFDALVDAGYVDPVQVVPDGFEAEIGGYHINDFDAHADNVTTLISGSISGDVIAGGLNDDTVHSLGGDDVVWGGSGMDTLLGGSGDDTLFGNQGNDDIRGGGGSDVMCGGPGDDILRGCFGDDIFEGGEGADLIFGNDGGDVLFGDDGSDSLYGGNGDDELSGGEDDDLLKGGDSNDVLFGGSGADRLFGGLGADHLLGGLGEDFLNGGSGDDTLSGNQGNDDIRGGSGWDAIFGDLGDDILRGCSGNDSVHGGDGEDLIFGNDGSDELYGGQGADLLNGGSGDDKLDGGENNDVLTGRDGSDVFIFTGGHDTITDFTNDVDELWINSEFLAGDTFSSVLAVASYSADHNYDRDTGEGTWAAILNFDANNSLTVFGIDMNYLQSFQNDYLII